MERLGLWSDRQGLGKRVGWKILLMPMPMPMPDPPALPSVPRRRSLLVTLLAWVMLLMGALGLPISAITALMILAKSYGTANAGFLDSCVVVLGPALVMVTGWGLFMRWRWALWVTIGLLVVVGMDRGWAMMKGPRETKVYTTESGVKVTEMGAGVSPYALPMGLVCAGLVGWLVSGRVRAEFEVTRPPALPTMAPLSEVTSGEEARGWRVGHRGRDLMFYEEKVAGVWQRLEIDGEMLTGRAHHVIYLASAEVWRGYPEWARERREEIVARVKSVFREPDYEYQTWSSASGPVVAGPSVLEAHVGREKVTWKQWAAMAAVILVLMGVSGGMGWMVAQGISRGETKMPSKYASHRRVLKREEEPVSFWAALGVYGLVGLGSGVGAGWFGREAWRLKRGG